MKEYLSYEDMEKDYVSGTIHPGDLKVMGRCLKLIRMATRTTNDEYPFKK